MAERNKGGFWLNIETIIIGAFFLFFIIWAVQKCNNSPKTKQYEMEKSKEQARLRDSINKARAATVVPPANVSVAPTPVPAAEPIPTPAPQPAQPTVQQPATPTTATPPKKVEGQTLYVVIDGLNVRAEPDLKSKSFGKLKLFDEVSFLGKVTDDTQKLSIGTEEANEPWIKIKTKRGTIGWVYGAGVSYYKKKRKGTL